MDDASDSDSDDAQETFHEIGKVLALQMATALLDEANKLRRRQEYNAKRGRLTRKDLTPVSGTETAWKLLFTAGNNRSVVPA